MSSTQVIVRIAVVAAMKKKKKKATNRLQSRVTKKLNVNDLAHHLLKIAAVTIVTTVTEIVKEIEETGEIGITVMTDTVESKVAVKVALKLAANNELKVAVKVALNNELKVAVKVALKLAANNELKVAEKVELKVILTAIVTAIMIEGEAVGMTETDVMIVHVEETMTMIGDAVSEVAMSVHLSAKEVDLVTEVPLSKALELVAPLAGPLLVCQVKSVVL